MTLQIASQTAVAFGEGRRRQRYVSKTSRHAETLLRAGATNNLEGMFCLSSDIKSATGLSGIYPLERDILVTTFPKRNRVTMIIRHQGEHPRDAEWLNIRLREGQAPDIRYNTQKRVDGGWKSTRIEHTPQVLNWLKSIAGRFAQKH